ncbi:MAG TPA: D-sedoheptulose 7-phosphate isomerase [bacterium]|nr:D-sedoheptulose 7-phosphate isomerase [bacterium]
MNKHAWADEFFRRSEAAMGAYREAGYPGLFDLVTATVAALQRGNQVFLFGNGGSAADAQHWAAEFVNRYLLPERPALAALALTTDTSILTSVGNDRGFADLFARQIQALARPGDLAVGISTSGRSENILRALRAARERGCVTVGFAGGDGGEMRAWCDHLLLAPSDHTPVIQQVHEAVGHLWVDLVEQTLAEEP